jgi:3-hydroxyacyl-[acyl-carrier-protein] dehydratase
MRFRQLDHIDELVPGERIKATRSLDPNSDYLRDHFPLFPVMPGVLMLEALFQASSWLIRATEDFENSVLILKEAKSVKFADFMEPGELLEITAEIVKTTGNLVSIKASGNKGDVVAVSARLTIEKSSLGDDQADLQPLDVFLRHSMRNELNRLMKT